MCFSLAWLQQILILCIVIGGVFAILKLLIPYVLTQMGATVGPGLTVVISAVKIVIWCIIAICVVIICFELIGCLLSMTGGLHLPSR